MASDNDSSCVCDPNFAIICSFLEKFGKVCGITYPDFNELQEMIENTQEVPDPLNELHIKLLRKVKRSVNNDRWEKALIKFCHSYSNQDAWEIERFGYKKSRVSVKLRILKTLLEAQFDLNPKFKTEVNKIPTEELRLEPIGKDKKGFLYWYQIDEFCNVRVYREDPDEETWELIAKDRTGIVSIISQLSGDNNDTVESVTNEDSNSLEIEKPITDTGQVEEMVIDEDSKNPSINSQDSVEIATKFTTKIVKQPQDDEIKEELTASENILEKSNDNNILKTDNEESLNLKSNTEELPDKESTSENSDSINSAATSIKEDNSDKSVNDSNKENAERKSDTISNISNVDNDKISKNSNPESSTTEEKTLKRCNDDKNLNNSKKSKTIDEKLEDDEVGKEITETTMIIQGEGSGKECDSMNDYILKRFKHDNSIVEDEIVEDILYFYGEGSGHECTAANTAGKDKDEDIKEENKTSSDVNMEKIDSLTSKPETSSTSDSENKLDITETCRPKQDEDNCNNDTNLITPNKSNAAPLPVTKRFLLSAKENKNIQDIEKQPTINDKNEKSDTKSSEDLDKQQSMFFFGPGSLTKKLDSVVTDVENDSKLSEEQSIESNTTEILPLSNINDKLETELKKEISIDQKHLENLDNNEKNQSSCETKVENHVKDVLSTSDESIENINEDDKGDIETKVENHVKDVKLSTSGKSTENTNKEDIETKVENHVKDVKLSTSSKSTQENINQVDIEPKCRTLSSDIKMKVPSKPERLENSNNEKNTSLISVDKTEIKLNVEQTNTNCESNVTTEISSECNTEIKLNTNEINLKNDKEINTINETNQKTSPPIVEMNVPSVNDSSVSLKSNKEEKDNTQQSNKQDCIKDIATVKCNSKTKSKLNDTENIKIESKLSDKIEVLNNEHKSKDEIEPLLNKLQENTVIVTRKVSKRLKKQINKIIDPLMVVTEDNDSINKPLLMCVDINKLKAKPDISKNILPNVNKESKKKRIINSKTSIDPIGTLDTDSLDNIDEDPLSGVDLDLHKNIEAPELDHSDVSSINKPKTRKREREQDTDEHSGHESKRLRSKNRHVDTELRKSIEQKKLIMENDSSSDEEEKNVAKIPLNESRSPRRQVARRGGSRPMQTRSAASITPSTTTTVSKPPQTKIVKPKTIIKPVRNMELLFPELIAETKKKPRKLLGLEIDENISLSDDSKLTPIRQSRRIAQIKIKEEAERRKIEELTLADMKSQSNKTKDGDKKKKKGKNYTEDEDYSNSEEEEEEEEFGSKKKSKKKKKGLKFDELNPWKSSSGSSSSDEEDVEPEIEEEITDDEVLVFRSDHEFSPESDLEENLEVQPLRRARTAKVESDIEEVDDYACQKCGKSDHPEWILLCDSCDFGWHCSCLRPALLVIPEGDWFCPPCQHITLISRLKLKLEEFDKQEKKIETEILHRQRLQYVGISMANVLPLKEQEKLKGKGEYNQDVTMEYENGDHSDGGSDMDSSRSGSSGDSSSEPIYQLRQRRQANSYRFNEYDDLINSAIRDELEAVKGAGNQGRGKDINTIVNAEKEEAELEKRQLDELKDDGDEQQSRTSADEIDQSKDNDFQSINDEIPPVVKRTATGKKKHAKLTSLDVESDDDENSDEDFKGSSSEEDVEEESGSDESGSTYARNRRNATVRRSSRRRATRYDNEFINDDTDDDIPRKKTKSIWDDSESEESDGSWGNRRKRTKKPRNISPKPKKIFWKPKKKKNRITSDNESETEKKPKRPKIKYGGLTDEDESISSLPRTRGKKINYLEALGSDSEEDQHKSTVKPLRESEDEFVLNEEEEEDDDEEVIKNDKLTESIEPTQPSEEIAKETIVDTPVIPPIENTSVEKKPDEEPVAPVTPDKPIPITPESGLKVEDNKSLNNSSLTPPALQTENLNTIPISTTPRGSTKNGRGGGSRRSRGGRGATRDSLSPRGTLSYRGRGRGRGRPRGSTLTSFGNFQDRTTLLQTSHDSNKSDSFLKTEVQKAATPISDEEDSDDDSEEDESETDDSDLEEGEIPPSRFRNLYSDDFENLDEDELAELMMEEEAFANKQLEIAGAKIAKQKKKDCEEKQNKKLTQNEEKLEINALNQTQTEEKPILLEKTAKQDELIEQEIKKNVQKKQKMEFDPSNSFNMTSPGVLLPTSQSSIISNPNTDIAPLFNESNSSFKSEESKTSDGFPQTTTPIRNMLMQHSTDMINPESDISEQPAPPKRRGRGKGKKTLAAEAAAAAAKATSESPIVSDNSSKGIPTSTLNTKLGIAPPPQPFLQAQPTPSVITRMLQSAPVGPTQNFNPLSNSMGPRFFNPSGPPTEGLPPRGPGSVLFTGRAVPNVYRPPSSTPPSQVLPISAGATPIFHSTHHPLDPSPSGGGSITITASSAVDKNSSLIIQPVGANLLNPIRMNMPPPPIASGTGPPQIRHHLPPFPSTPQQTVPPRPPGSFSPYPPPPNYQFGTYPPPPPILAPTEDTLPPAYQGSSSYSEHYIPPPESESISQPVLESTNSKPFEEETGGEFGGLVSYFSSQREDDIDS